MASPRGTQRSWKINLFNRIAKYLKAKGWTVNNRMQGRAYPLHKVKHQFINEVLSEENARLAIIRINYHACKYLLSSIKNAPLDKDHQKNKTAERQNIPQETATHLSDAFDYAVFYFLFSKNRAVNGHSPARIGGRVI